MTHDISTKSIINLRGGGCGSGKVALLEPSSVESKFNRELPSSLFSMTQARVKSLLSKILTIAEKSVQDEYLNTINWLDINEYWYQRIPDDKSNMIKCIKLLQFILVDILEIVQSIIDGSRFIAYSLIRVANNFSRIIVVYYTKNEGTYLDLDLSNGLKEKISCIKEIIEKLGETSLYYNGLQYESGITEACINICPVDDPQGRELGCKALIEIIKSAASFSPSADLFSSLGNLALFGVKTLYQKYKESNFKEMMTKCLFIEQFKWTVVTCIEKDKFSIKQVFNSLAKFYQNEVLYSKSWEVKYCWIKANHWIMAYKIIITKEMCRPQNIDRFDSHWYQLISQQMIQIIDRSDHDIGAIVNEDLIEKLNLSETNQIYSKITKYTHSINRIKQRLLSGSEKLPKILHYDQEFASNDKYNEANLQLLEVQNKLKYLNIGGILTQFAQIYSLMKNILLNINDMDDLIKDLDYENPDQDHVHDICQSAGLIVQQLRQLISLIINLRVNIIQLGFVADNFIEAIFKDDQLKKDHSEKSQIIKCTINLSQIHNLLVEYENSDSADNEKYLQLQSIVLNYITNILQEIESQETQDLKLISQIKEIELEQSIRNNFDIRKKIYQNQQINQSLGNTLQIDHLDIIRIIIQLQKSKNFLHNIDGHLQELEQINVKYQKLSFIPKQFIKEHYTHQKADIIQTQVLRGIQVELNLSYGQFKDINMQFEKILSNKQSFDKLSTFLNKETNLVSTAQQNKQIIEEVIFLKCKHLEISSTIIQSESIAIQSNQCFQQIAGILDLQNSLILQQLITTQQLQQIIQNIISIDKVQKEDNKQNNLLMSLKSTLEQTVNNLSELILIKFIDLLDNVKNQDQSYVLEFKKLNDHLKIEQWNVQKLNEDLLKKVQSPSQGLAIQSQVNAEKYALLCENFRNSIKAILEAIQLAINYEDIFGVRKIITSAFLENVEKNSKLSEQTLRHLISKFNSFNSIGSKNQIEIDILVSDVILDLQLIQDHINGDQLVQQDTSIQGDDHNIFQQPHVININIVDNFTKLHQVYQSNSNSLKRIIKFTNTYKNELNIINNQRSQKMDALINSININFNSIVNCIYLPKYIKDEQVLESIQSQFIKIHKLLDLLNIPQNLNIEQLQKCLDQNPQVIMTRESTQSGYGDQWRLRECQLFNILITQQKLINQYQTEYSQQLIVFKAIETDNRIQKILKNSNFILQQQYALEKHWKQQSSSIQHLISHQLSRLQQLQKQIQSQQPGPDRDQLFLDHQALEAQIDQQIENVSSIGNSLGITIAFIKDLKKELLTIQDQLKEMNSKLSDISMDIKFLIGKSPQQLLEIRMEKVLKQKTIDDARTVYVQLYTKEMIDFDQQKEAEQETPMSNSTEEQEGEIDEFIKSSKQRSLLIHGAAGSGKSTAAKKVEEYLWTRYKQLKIASWDDVKEPPIIPIFIQLPTLKDAKFKALLETLKSQTYLFNDKQIADLQKYVIDRKIRLFIIMDSYDELNRYYIEQNLNITNKFDQWCESSNYQILNTTRSEIFTTKTEYRTWFTATSAKPSKETFKEIRILPFNTKQRNIFYDQYSKLSLKQAIIDIYDILLDQRSTKTDTALIIKELWEEIIQIFNNNNFVQEKLLDQVQIESIVQLINNSKNNKIDLYKDQEMHFKQQLSALWSSEVYQKNINSLGIVNLVETPYMTNIVVSVLPQLIEEFSSLDHLKPVFIRNIQPKLEYNNNRIFVELQPNEIWDVLVESKALVDYKIGNNKISMDIKSKISGEIDIKLQFLIQQSTQQDQIVLLNNLLVEIQAIKQSQDKFDTQKLFALLQDKQYLFEDLSMKQLLQILLCNTDIIESIQQNQPTSYDFYKMFLSEYIKKQIMKLTYNQMNFQIGKFYENANEYVQKLGTLMTVNQLTSIEYHQKGIIDKRSQDGLQEQLFQLFDDNAEHPNIKAQIRTSIPLKVRGDSFSFFHKSIQEYLFAKNLIDLFEYMKQLEVLKIQELFQYRKSMKYEDWEFKKIQSYDDFRKQYKVKVEQVKILIRCLENLQYHLINEKIYKDEFFIGSINFIVNKIKNNPELIKTIMILLQISKLGGDFQNCTSNCFHIINRATISLVNKDLSGIHVNKISIRNVNLKYTDLSYSNFNKVDINGINLVNANLSYCKWQKLVTNELPILNVKSFVNSVAYSPNNLYIASASNDGDVILWDAQLGKQIGDESLKGHIGCVYSLSYSPDGQIIASGGEDKTIRIWDTKTNKQIGESFSGHTGQVRSVSYSSDGKFIASGGDDKMVRIWDSQSGRQIGESLSGHEGFICSVSFAPNSKHIAAGSYDNTIRTWDVQSGKQVGESHNGHTDYVRSLSYSPDGKFIASGSEDYTVRIWDAQSVKQIGASFKGHSDSVWSVAYSPNGKFIISGSEDNTVRIWDVQSGKQIGESLNGHGGSVRSVQYSLDGKFIISGSHDKTVRIWDAQSAKQTGESFNIYNGSIWSVAYSPDGNQIACGIDDKSIRILDAHSGKQIGESLKGHAGSIRSINYSPNGKFISSGSDDSSIRVWDIQSGKQSGDSLIGHTGPVWSVSHSPNGRFIASGSKDKTVRIWDVQSRKQIGETFNVKSVVWSVQYSPDSTLIASGSKDGMLRIWDTQLGKQIGESLESHLDTINQISYSPDGKFIVTGSDDKTGKIWDIESRKQIGESLIGHNRSIISISYSNNGKIIASGSSDNTVRIWDAQSGKQIGQSLKGHTDTVLSVQFSPDDKFIVSGSQDKTVRIWDINSLRQIYPREEHYKTSSDSSSNQQQPEVPNMLKHNYCILRIPNAGPIMYHGCNVLEAQIQSRLGIDVLELWKNREKEIQ